MKVYNKVKRRLPELLNIPDQTLPGVPIIELYGDSRVLIEGRCTIVQYERSSIRLRNTCGMICINGCGLCVAELTDEQMIITGRIDGISLHRG